MNPSRNFHFQALQHDTGWIPSARLPGNAVPSGLKPWLLDPTSLTRRLRQACGGKLSVEVLAEEWEQPAPEERTALRMPVRHTALIREIFLRCNGVPWVYARTVLPYSTLRGRYRRLARLGNRPLGTVLFAGSAIYRERLEVARLQSEQGPVWGRRSRLIAGGRPLLVSEYFIGPIPPRGRQWR